MTSGQPKRRISIRSILRNPPDTRKLARALIAQVLAEAEAEAQAQDEETKKASATDRPNNEGDET
jgi:hypothetical protein